MRLHEVFTKVRPRNKDQTADESANELTLFSVGHGNNLQISGGQRFSLRPADSIVHRRCRSVEQCCKLDRGIRGVTE